LTKRIVAPLVLLVIAATLPFWLFTDVSGQTIATLTIIWIGGGIAWNMMSGFSGQISLGHAMFFGIGAYGMAILQTDLNVNPWLGLVIVAVFAAIASLPLMVAFRVRGVYFALLTFAVVLILQQIAASPNDLTHSDNGISLPLLGDDAANFQFLDEKVYYLIALAFVAVYFLISVWVYRSRLGLHLRSIRDDEAGALASGVPVFRVKVTGLVLSAALTGLIGGLYMQVVQFIDPASAFGPQVLTTLTINPIAGGLGTIWGPVVGGAVLYPLEQYLGNAFPGLPSGFGVIVSGVIVIALMIAEPKGLVGLITRIYRAIRRHFGSSTLVPPPVELKVPTLKSKVDSK
jgi:branched-chain amino acid transport system permease protein